MKEEQKYDWSYSIAYFITIYPIFIISNWITEGWSNIKFGESALSSVLITIVFHIILKYKQRRKSKKQEK